MESNLCSEDSTVNPCPPEWLNEDENALLRGDAIGDTVYTHRWLLKCLLSITQSMSNYLKTKEYGREGKVKDGDQELHFHYDNEDIIELDEEVENSCCQLWDMTVERDVCLHLLSLKEIDIIQVVSLVINQSKAPRLTEVLVGVLGNMCCQEEVCERVFCSDSVVDDNILGNVVQLLGCTSDVPTLNEALRLIRQLIWHRINRTPENAWSSCPLLQLFCQTHVKTDVAFLLNNSLSDILVDGLLKLLMSLLFVRLPKTGLYIASLYSDNEIIEGLLDILLRKLPDVSQDKTNETIVHNCVMCIYAFIDTPAANIIESKARENATIEASLVSYLRNESMVSSQTQILDATEKLISIIGICTIFIPIITRPSILMTVGRLLAIINGHTQEYSVSRSTSREDTIISAEKADLDCKKSKANKNTVELCDASHNDRSVIGSGWVSPPPFDADIIVNSEAESKKDYSKEEGKRRTLSISHESLQSVLNTVEIDESECLSEYQKEQLSSLEESLGDYCLALFSWHFLIYDRVHKPDSNNATDAITIDTTDNKTASNGTTLSTGSSNCDKSNNEVSVSNLPSYKSSILKVLDQCHAHEVLLILQALKARDALLVPLLQEYILDAGKHLRLVALLAHMYQ